MHLVSLCFICQSKLLSFISVHFVSLLSYIDKRNLWMRTFHTGNPETEAVSSSNLSLVYQTQSADVKGGLKTFPQWWKTAATDCLNPVSCDLFYCCDIKRNSCKGNISCSTIAGTFVSNTCPVSMVEILRHINRVCTCNRSSAAQSQYSE